MKKEIKERWVAALRSGEYQQGFGALRVGDKFCCLGVLCDLAVKDGVRVGVSVRPGRTPLLAQEYMYDGWSAGLPRSVARWAGIGDLDPRVADPRRAMSRSLVLVNDGGTSFAEIADLIENHLIETDQ